MRPNIHYGVNMCLLHTIWAAHEKDESILPLQLNAQMLCVKLNIENPFIPMIGCPKYSQIFLKIPGKL